MGGISDSTRKETLIPEETMNTRRGRHERAQFRSDQREATDDEQRHRDQQNSKESASNIVRLTFINV